MFDFQTLSENRNKLMNDATKLAQTKEITKEQRTQVDTMLADVVKIEADMATAKRLADFAAEQRSAQMPPRGKLGENGDGNLEAERRALRNYLVTGERRDLGTVTSGPMTAGNQLIAPAFFPILTTAQQSYGGVVNVVNQRTTDTGAPMKVSLVDDVSNGLLAWPEDTTATAVDPSLANVTSTTTQYHTGAIFITLEELQDSFFSIDSFVSDVLGQRLYRGLAKYVSQGDGTGAYQGLWANLPSGGTSAAPAAVSYIDLATLSSSLDPAYEANATWLMSSATRGQLIATTDTLGRPLFIPSPTCGAFDTLLGRPVVIDQYAPTVAAGHTAVAFGDFKQYMTLRNVGAFEIARDPYTYLISKGAVAFIGYGRGGSFITDAGTHPAKALTQHA